MSILEILAGASVGTLTATGFGTQIGEPIAGVSSFVISVNISRMNISRLVYQLRGYQAS